MIFKFTKITDATNTIVGPTNTNGGKIYSIDSMLIANNHSAGIIAHVTDNTQHGYNRKRGGGRESQKVIKNKLFYLNFFIYICLVINLKIL